MMAGKLRIYISVTTIHHAFGRHDPAAVDACTWESFREGTLTAGGSFPGDECIPVTLEASNPPD